MEVMKPWHKVLREVSVLCLLRASVQARLLFWRTPNIQDLPFAEVKPFLRVRNHRVAESQNQSQNHSHTITVTEAENYRVTESQTQTQLQNQRISHRITELQSHRIIEYAELDFLT